MGWDLALCTHHRHSPSSPKGIWRLELSIHPQNTRCIRGQTPGGREMGIPAHNTQARRAQGHGQQPAKHEVVAAGEFLGGGRHRARGGVAAGAAAALPPLGPAGAVGGGFQKTKGKGGCLGPGGPSSGWVINNGARPPLDGPPPLLGAVVAGQVQRQNPIPGTDCGTQLWGLKKKFPRFASQNGGRHMEALFPRGPTPQGESLGRLAHSPPSPVTNPEK